MLHVYSCPIETDYNRIDTMLTWAKTNCASYITGDAVRTPTDWQYQFKFGNESDLTMFVLRWS
jgi:hypothetical protein